jgi:predicted site-specific integrase-resolvase
MTPADLAPQLGITSKALRDWLRRTYPRSAAERHQRWHLDDRMVAAARRHFS